MRKLLALTALTLVGCASPPMQTTGAEWHAVSLPGKRSTHYAWTHKDGRPAWAATSEGSASMWRRRVNRTPERLGDVNFSWWVSDLVADANVAVAERADAPARVMFAFDGDVSRLPQRTRVMFELAEALTGEKPPYATLVYVWDATAPVGSVIVNPRTDRIRKIVVDSGPAKLRRWRDHKRNLAADYRLAFGEEPGPLAAIALMTDSDNTASRAVSWYGPVTLESSSQP
ncbi:MAG: DUF3047 domain-containing protein [Rubrivivax sp.]|nr:DUF3047 domain-containing protein [Rubrivivax sp.]